MKLTKEQKAQQLILRSAAENFHKDKTGIHTGCCRAMKQSMRRLALPEQHSPSLRHFEKIYKNEPTNPNELDSYYMGGDRLCLLRIEASWSADGKARYKENLELRTMALLFAAETIDEDFTKENE